MDSLLITKKEIKEYLKKVKNFYKNIEKQNNNKKIKMQMIAIFQHIKIFHLSLVNHIKKANQQAL